MCTWVGSSALHRKWHNMYNKHRCSAAWTHPGLWLLRLESLLRLGPTGDESSGFLVMSKAINGGPPKDLVLRPLA